MTAANNRYQVLFSNPRRRSVGEKTKLRTKHLSITNDGHINTVYDCFKSRKQIAVFSLVLETLVVFRRYLIVIINRVFWNWHLHLFSLRYDHPDFPLNHYHVQILDCYRRQLYLVGCDFHTYYKWWHGWGNIYAHYLPLPSTFVHGAAAIQHPTSII